MNSIVNVMQGCIEPAFQLKREQECWAVVEENPGAANKKLLVNGSGIYGFSLDSPGVPKPVWKFLKPSSLEGICSVCDGVFVTTYKDVDYFVVIDLKSYAATGAVKQVITGIHLCQWFYSVLRLHGHLTKKVGYVGVISKLSRRRQPYKRCTVRNPLPDPDTQNGFPIFTIENENRLSLTKVCEVVHNL
ncbi:hypothetical protein [Cronobacter sakazakii]|uniref:hypothetical protein n=1 Tax=Cronobacter sakazakii TaxID=28141 RepID=UPI000DA1F072|nr:hypothetical protein [Cronobacter sakazakii]MCI0302362.1 hypothetical protein [Cronobacter sakazakii]